MRGSPRDADGDPPKKRQRRGSVRGHQDLTTDVLDRFNEANDTCKTRQEFTALCGYLCALLTWGWTLRESSMDAFILRHDEYLAELPAFEEQQCTSPAWSIPAYHQWLHRDATFDVDKNLSIPAVLNEENLRAVGEENPCVFWIADMTLEYVQASRP